MNHSFDSLRSPTGNNSNSFHYSSTASPVQIDLSSIAIESLSLQLRTIVRALQRRGLHVSSKWACELLIGMAASQTTSSSNIFSLEEDDENVPPHEIDIVLFAQTLVAAGDFQRCAYLLRKHSLASYSPHSLSSSPFYMTSRLGTFLGAYSLYMAGEKVKEQETVEGTSNNGDTNDSKSNSPTGRKGSGANKDANSSKKNATTLSFLFAEGVIPAKNPYLNDIYRELLPIYRKSFCSSPSFPSDLPSMDGYLMYIFAVVVRDLRRYGSDLNGIPSELLSTENTYDNLIGEYNEESDRIEKIPSVAELLIMSLRLCPCNWSAWLELAEDVTSQAQQRLPTLEEVFGTEANSVCRTMYLCFLVHLHLEWQQGDTALKLLQDNAVGGLARIFPSSQIIATQTALAHYCLRDYDRAQDAFEMSRDADPHRLDHIDTYSNILYVKEKRAELSHLAHAVAKADKYAPESCCVVGNYYSLKGHHERAIIYFQRALRLNRLSLSAWTLMGHEFVELRNTAAAVQCYRKAVDVSSRDYRAWYGLGQTYEMLHMYQYALHYYKKAAALKPSDARMWCAVGNCYSRLGSRKEAMIALERAVSAGDTEGIATRELARLYRDAGKSAKAAECYHRHLQTLGIGSNMTNQNQTIDAERAEGLLFLAYYHRSQGDLSHAEEYCIKLGEYIGPEGDEARAIMREIRSLAQQEQGQEHSRTSSPMHNDEDLDQTIDISDNGGINSSISFSINNSQRMEGMLEDSDFDEEDS